MSNYTRLPNIEFRFPPEYYSSSSNSGDLLSSRPAWISDVPRNLLFQHSLLQQQKERKLHELAAQLRHLESQRQLESVALLPLNERAYTFLMNHTNFPKAVKPKPVVSHYPRQHVQQPSGQVTPLSATPTPPLAASSRPPPNFRRSFTNAQMEKRPPQQPNLAIDLEKIRPSVERVEDVEALFDEEDDEEALNRDFPKALFIDGGRFVFDSDGLRITANGIEALPEEMVVPSARSNYEPLALEQLQLVSPIESGSVEKKTMWVVRDLASGAKYCMKYYSIRGMENRKALHTDIWALFETFKKASNILQPIEAFLDSGHLRIALLTEYCELRSIKDVMAIRGAVPEPVMAAIIYQILLGLECVHSKGRIHASLSCEHVLISSKGEVRLSNFSRALRLTAPDLDLLFEGNEQYSSPEMLLGLEIGPASDIWALGLLSCEMATNEPTYSPAQCPSLLDFKSMVVEGQIGNEKLVGPHADKSSFSEDFLSVVNRCLSRFPRKRPTIKELFQDPLLRRAGVSAVEYVHMWATGQTAKLKSMMATLALNESEIEAAGLNGAAASSGGGKPMTTAATATIIPPARGVIR